MNAALGPVGEHTRNTQAGNIVGKRSEVNLGIHSFNGHDVLKL